MKLREFAEAIGVPVGTVSKALNTQVKYRISPEKVAYIRAKAQELGFRQEFVAGSGNKIRRIGLLCGPMFTYLGGFLYEGVRDVCNAAGVRLTIVGCDNNPDSEKIAFRQICSEPIDALLYWPAVKTFSAFEMQNLQNCEKAAAKFIPVIYICGKDVPDGAYAIRFREVEVGIQAAQRQLALGCRKFVILRYDQVWEEDRAAEDSYRNTLLKHGITASAIKVITLNFDSPRRRFAAFKEADGVWANHLFLLRLFANSIAYYRDLKKLHVDGTGFLEFYSAMQAISSAFLRSVDIPDALEVMYASSGARLYSLRAMGALAAEQALEIAYGDRTKVDREIYMNWWNPSTRQC